MQHIINLVVWVRASFWTCVRPLGGPYHQWCRHMFENHQSSPKLHRPMFMSTCSAPPKSRNSLQANNSMFILSNKHTKRWYNLKAKPPNIHNRTHEAVKPLYTRQPANTSSWKLATALRTVIPAFSNTTSAVAKAAGANDQGRGPSAICLWL